MTSILSFYIINLNLEASVFCHSELTLSIFEGEKPLGGKSIGTGKPYNYMGPAALLLDGTPSAQTANLPPSTQGRKRKSNFLNPTPAKLAIISEAELEAAPIQNHAIRQVVSVLRDSESVAGTSDSDTSTSNPSIFWKTISSLKLADLEAVNLALTKRKNFLTYGASPSQNTEFTLDFLGELRRAKLQNKLTIERQLEILSSDLECLREVPSVVEQDYVQELFPFDTESETEDRNCPELIPTEDDPKSLETSEMLKSHFDDLCTAYWKLRDPGIINGNHTVVSDGQQESLEAFERIVDQVSGCQKLKKIANIHYSVDLYRRPCLVCTVDFDRDGEYFAAAGSAKYIRLYQYDSVITNPIGASCPVGEFWCGSTVSQVSWNGYFKNSLVSSGYDGVVNTWDAATLSSVRTIKGHQKKIWSVKWSKRDPRIFASASDDASVRVWSSISHESPLVLTLQSSACDVDFSPADAYTISVACADRNMYLYDLRNPREPTKTFKGHSRTVSGARFTSEDELMTCSIDGQILLWNKENEEPVGTFKGHKNEKNFIGLASNGDFIAAGSEDDKVYIYHKAIQKPLASFQFEDHERILDGPMCGSSAGFVSAIAWKKNSSVLLAANSWGAISVLRME